MPNWLSIGLFALAKLPVDKLFYRKRDPTKSLAELEEKLLPVNRLLTPTADTGSRVGQPPVSKPSPSPGDVTTPQPRRITTAETVEYQKRELGKEIMLLEKHLQQKCKIMGIACDCCEKHPIVIEGLALETLGMTGDKLYEDVIAWAKHITPITTESASRSGVYDDMYPKLAVEGRNIRKRIMGTADVKALLSPAMKETVNGQVKAIIDQVTKKEGVKHDGGKVGRRETVQSG